MTNKEAEDQAELFDEKLHTVEECEGILRDIAEELSTAATAETLEQVNIALDNVRDLARSLVVHAR